jgi:phosphinothricin acetyltransferase
MPAPPPSLRILDAEPAHLPGVVEIYNQAVRDTFSIWSEAETTLAQRRHWLETRRSQGFPVLVAVDQRAPDETLAYASFGIFRDFPGYVGTVEHSVYVRPSAQRMGLGCALLGDLIARAREKGLHSMIGGVDSSNIASIALHESLGFEVQGVLRGVGRKFGKSLDLVFLVKTL